MKLLEIKNLHVEIEDKKILKGLNLELDLGKTHAIMGPNGSGKSTLSYVIAGKEDYEITEGEILFNGVDLLELEAHERSLAGIFLAFQYPVEIPGVNTTTFLKHIVNAKRRSLDLEEIDVLEFVKLMRQTAKKLNIDEGMLKRPVNVGYSGGEKKKAEIMQLALLEPKLSILDETDSGLDIDSLRIVSEGVNSLKSEKNSFLIITHYQRLLNYIKPDFVHIMADGKIVKTGDYSLALKLEEDGYEPYLNK